MEKNSEHLKALTLDFVVDILLFIILFLAYGYVLATLDIKVQDGEISSEIIFMRNALIFIAPGSIESLGIISSKIEDNVNEDLIVFVLAGLIILTTIILTIQCASGIGIVKYAKLYKYVIAIYPIKVITSAVFDFFNLYKERRENK